LLPRVANDGCAAGEGVRGEPQARAPLAAAAGHPLDRGDLKVAVAATFKSPCPSGGHGYTSPTEEDVPLKGWIREHLGPEAVAP
jgi:hypothetical protein